MALRHRLVCAFLALMFLFCAGAQAAGREYIFSDPVLYVDDEPVFILQNLSISAGARDDGGSGVAWLDVCAGDDISLKSAAGLDDTGIFAALGGIPSAYGISGSTFAMLAGVENARAAYDLFTQENLTESGLALVENLLIPLESGSQTEETAPLSAGETPYTAKNVSGMIDISAVTAAAGSIPLYSGIISAAQVLGKAMPDIGQWSIAGSYGHAGEGENKSLICNIAASHGENSYNISLIADNSASPASVTLTVSGADAEINFSAKSVPGSYVTATGDGHISDAWFEAELQTTSEGDIQFGGGVYLNETGEMSSATVICQGGEFYYAVSRDIGGAETNLYLTSDTVINEDGSRSGIATLGAYDAQGRVELVADLSMLTGAEIGAGRAVDAAYSSEIITLTGDARNNLKTSVVNVINGAMYVLSLHVPGFTYTPIDSLDISGLISGETE